MTLRLKLFFLLAGVTIFSTSGVTAVALWRELVRGQELLAREGAALASSVAPDVARWMGADGAQPGAREAVSATLDRLVGEGPLDRAWVVDRAGKIVACHDHTGQGCPEGAPTTFAPPEGPADVLLRLIEPRGLETASPVLKDGALVAAVRVHFGPEEVVGGARAIAWSSALVAGFWIFLGQILAAILLATITRSVSRVIAGAEHVGHGESGLQLPVPEEKDLAELAQAFNAMSSRLAARREENVRLIGTLEQRVAQKTREVLRADRLATLGGIAAGFAHELGNSLNVIRGYTAVVLRELPKDHANRGDLDAVKRETSRAATLLERFLVFARSRDTRTLAQPLEPVLREAVEVVGPAAAQARVTTRVDVAPGVPDVNVDAELLRQAFLNLCVNAVHAMGAQGGGTLTARLRAEGEQVVAEVEDTGPGIAADHVDHVFEPFYTTKAEGTGLGLAIVRQAAETHGGTVEVTSAPGQGATFRVRLPAAATAPAVAPAAKETIG
jgi:two-component system, NtrC family, sensor kinase